MVLRLGHSTIPQRQNRRSGSLLSTLSSGPIDDLCSGLSASFSSSSAPASPRAFLQRRLIIQSSPGYGISLVAETTSAYFLSVETTISYPRGYDEIDVDDKKELMPADEVGEQIAASLLLGEIEQGGVVDSTHQAASQKKGFCQNATNTCWIINCLQSEPSPAEARRRFSSLATKFFITQINLPT